MLSFSYKSVIIFDQEERKNIIQYKKGFNGHLSLMINSRIQKTKNKIIFFIFCSILQRRQGLIIVQYLRHIILCQIIAKTLSTSNSKFIKTQIANHLNILIWKQVENIPFIFNTDRVKQFSLILLALEPLLLSKANLQNQKDKYMGQVAKVYNFFIFLGLAQLSKIFVLIMGAFLKSIQSQKYQKPDFLQFFCKNSLTKLSQYYASFKAASQTYSIDNQQFRELFAHSNVKLQQLFECLDSDHNLLIDGLELFTGLALLSSNIQFKQKITFIFKMFDFNSLRSLSRTDIEFMVMSACNIVSKIYRISHQESFVQDFIRQEFQKDERINISQVLRWTCRSPIVAKFFQLIEYPSDSDPGPLISHKIYLTLPHSTSISKAVAQQVQRQQQSTIAKTSKLFKDLDQQQEGQQTLKINEIIPQANWVYGIRFKDTKQFIEIQAKQIIYYVGKIVILYNRMSRKQRHYLGHKQQIISLAKSTKNEFLVASGQYGNQPEIKIWNRKSLQTVISLKGHSQGIHLLQFIDDLVVSCGCNPESPLLIHSLQTGNIIFSSYTPWPAVDICQIQNFTNKPSIELVVGSLYGIDHLQFQRAAEKYTVKVTQLRDNEISKIRLTCVCFFMINATFQKLKQYDERVQKHLLAGYQNGEIILWNLAKCRRQLVFSSQGYQILGIIPTHHCLYVVTNSTFIISYDIAVPYKQKIATIDFTQIDQALSSYDLVNFKYMKEGLLLITQTADLVILNCQQPISRPNLSYFQLQLYPAITIPDILYFQHQIFAHKILKKENQNILFLAEGHCVKGIDLDKHCFVRQWNLGQKITAFDVISIWNASQMHVVGAKGSQNMSYLCFQLDYSELNNRQEVPGEIMSICLHYQQGNKIVIILVSTKDAIYKYIYSKGNFAKSTYLSLPQTYSRLTSLDSSKFLISNKLNFFQTVTANKQTQLHAQFVQQRSLTTLLPIKLYYCLLSFNNMSLVNIVGRKIKCLVVARLNGKIDLFNNYEDLSNLKPVTLLGHNSSIADIGLSQNQKKLISSGRSDGMIIEWSLRVAGQKKSAIRCRNVQQEQHIKQKRDDYFLSNKLDFCKFNNDVLSDTYDQHLMVSGIKNQNLRRLFKASLSDWKNMTPSREPSLNLKLDYIFGIETTHKNQTLLVIQQKKIMYFIGKIIVIYHIESNSQKFYRGHRFRVTCFGLLPQKTRVASGEASYHPIINIWSVSTLQTLLIIQTEHIGGIIELAVSKNIILSFGFRKSNVFQEAQTAQNLYSFQVYDYEHNQCLAYRPEKDFAYAIAIDPTNPTRYVSCNEGGVSFWQVSANRIIRRSLCLIQDTPTACIFYTGPNVKNQPDLIVGTISGAIGVVSRQRYWKQFSPGEKESKQVNCLLLAHRKQQTLILATYDNNLLRCWNQSFEQRHRHYLLKQEQSEEYRKSSENRPKEDYNRSLQSLCLFDQQKLKMIGVTRNSEIIELQINPGEKGKEIVESLITRFSGGFSQRGKGKVLVAHYPNTDILITLGQDNYLIFWNCDQKGKIWFTKQLDLDIQKTQPTALKLSRSGDILAIGFSDGLVLYLDSRIGKVKQGKGKITSQPSLTPTPQNSQSRENIPVVAIQISESGEYLAVSYHHVDSQKSIAIVKIYSNKRQDSNNNKPRISTFQQSKIYDLCCTVDNHHLQHPYISGSGKYCGFAACTMSFAQYQGGHYLLMFFDLLDENQNRVWITQAEQGFKYKILHVNNKTDSSNSSSLNELIKWRKPHIHRALSAHYLFVSNSSQIQPPANDHLRIPQFTNSVNLHDHLLVASHNGDIHILRSSSIQSPDSIAKTLPAHGCIINQIQYSSNRYVYTTGENDHCVIKWTVQNALTSITEQLGSEESKDLLGEIPEPQQLEKKLRYYESKFKRMGDGDSVPIPGFIQQLKVKQIIGRTSCFQRNNMKVDSKGRALYYSGQAIIAANLQTKSKQFLYLTNQRKLAQQVSAIEISKEGDILAAAYSGSKTQIVIWALQSKIIQNRMYLEDIAQVIYLNFSYDHSRLLVYGLRGMKAQGCLMLIDLNNRNILASATYHHKQSWQIKGLAFKPYSCDNFYTCGVQPIKQWSYQSGQLVYNIYPPTLETQANIVHTALVFAGQTLITGTDDGQLFVWHSTPTSHIGHQSMIINCLSAIKKSEDLIYIASGSQLSQPSQVLLWSFNKKDLKLLKKITAKCGIQNISGIGNLSSKSQSDLQVQSLAFWQDQLIIGLLKGDIFVYNCQFEEKDKGKAKHVLCFQDSQKTQSLFFINNYEYLVYISQNGLIRIWSFLDSNLIWSKHFNEKVVDMVYSHINEWIIIAFCKQLRVYQWGSDRRSLEERENLMIPFYSLSHLAISHNQKRIALGYRNSSDKRQIVNIYDIAEKNFTLIIPLPIINGLIDFIDFSRLSIEKTVLLIKTGQKVQLFDVTSNIDKQIKEISPQTAKKIDWLNNGLSISQKTEKARQVHSKLLLQATNICKIVEIGRSILIADADGLIIVVTDGQLTGKCKLGMSGIDFVAISPSNKWCAAASKQDRNIVILELLIDK